MEVLDLFHPLIKKWFSENVGRPTAIQQQAWPCIAAGEHVLISAPTGSGKTLTAFLWALQKLITRDWPGDGVRILYISPLKALNNDVRRNLLVPLQGLQAYFREAGEPFPQIRVLTRSGDTPQNERRRMQRHPPEILITTPESLNLLLSSKNSRSILNGVKSVILDEIHAVLESKRGTHLITAVDRLILLAGEFQRIALSATVRPLEQVAEFIGGLEAIGAGTELLYQKRQVTICQSGVPKKYNLSVDFVKLHEEAPSEDQDTFWLALAASLVKIINENRATLIFCNSRRAVEKLTRFINDAADESLVYAHHGSLAKELRLAVEEKLKSGGLRGIVATNSLELGIDIGELDIVLLVQAPPTLTSAIQRLGRAGHGVGQVSRGIIYPLCGRDSIEAAAISLSLPAMEIEPSVFVEAPLDLLAQVILSMTVVETWDVDDLYGFLRTSYPYRNLPRKSYDLLLEMLAGRYGETRLRELRPRIIFDKIDRTVKGRDGTARLIYLGGGSIPDRGYYDLRLADNKAKIGELDEEFVWERSLGETFMLGSRVWRIVRITHNDVEVVPGDQTINIIPFWKAEEQNRSFFYADKIGRFLEEAQQTSREELTARLSASGSSWSTEAAGQLFDFLELQKEVTGKPLPHRHHLLIENINDPFNKTDSKQVVLHTLWGGKINRPYSLALAAAWEEKYGYPLETYVNNNSIMLILPHSFCPEDLFAMVTPHNIEILLRRNLESTGFFGAKFRENAGRALLLPKADFKKRMPLWLNRLRAKKLMAAVTAYADFPIMLETWRTCLRDEFDLESLKMLLDEINDGFIAINETITGQPSPFSSDLLWQQTNKYMYMDDAPSSEKRSSLSQELLKELIYDPHLRPELSVSLIRELEGKLQRVAAGYAPADGEELLLWLKERLFIPLPEAEALFCAMERDHDIQREDLYSFLGSKAAWLNLPGGEHPGLCALEVLPRLVAVLKLESSTGPRLNMYGLRPEQDEEALRVALTELAAYPPLSEQEDTEDGEQEQLSGDIALFVSQWLSYYGPQSYDFVRCFLGLSERLWIETLDTLLLQNGLVADVRIEGDDESKICDRENLERLFFMARLARRPEFDRLPISAFPLFLTTYQGIADKGSTMEDLQERLERLFGYVSPVQLWEEVILPARMEPYYPAWMDSLLQTEDLLWFGRGSKRMGFCFREDLTLFQSDTAVGPSNDPQFNEAKDIFPDPWGKYDFLALKRYTGLETACLSQKLWELLWQGSIANDTLAVLRTGVLHKFEPAKPEERRSFSRRSGFKRWSSSLPMQGHWFILPERSTCDLLEQEDLYRERIRRLFSRYGVLFRELLQQELPEMQWPRIFRSLRLMEFSGEIVAGHFFERITGLQFASREALSLLRRDLGEEKIYWINAADPASPCGLKLPGLDDDLPPRLPANFIVFRGSSLKVVAKRNGKELLLKTAPDDPHIPAYFAFCKTLLTRAFNPLKTISVEVINGLPALQSPYRNALLEAGFTGYYKGLELKRKYT